MEKVKIRDVVSFVRGVSYKKDQSSQTPKEGFTAILRANNINGGEFNFDELVFVPSELVASKQMISKGDIVITMSSGSKAHVGKVAIAKNDIDAAFGAFCAKLVPENIESKYLYYILRDAAFRRHIEIASKGTNINNLKQEYILDYEIFVPSKEEQECVVNRVEELLSQLDEGVETLKKTQAQLKVYRQAVLVDAFSGDYPRVPLSTISKPLSGYAFKSKKYTPDGKYTVVKIGNVKSFHFDFSRDLTRTNESEGNILDKYLLQKGDCLITLTGSRGKRDYGYVAMITDQENFLLNQRVAALRFKTDIALPEFYQYYLSSPEYRNQFFLYETGNVGQGNVGIKALTDPLVVLPPIEKQQEIVTEIEARLTMCDNIEQTVDIALQQAEAMRQSILKRAFEGVL